MSSKLQKYELPKDSEDIHLRELHKAGGFATEVRDWHLDRIPKYTPNSLLQIKCPYCKRWRDSRSMQIDHIIPARVFIRYQLYENRRTYNTDTLRNHGIDSYYNDTDNLILSCMKCNSSGQDKLLSNEEYDESIKNMEDSEAANVLKRNKAIRAKIKLLPKNVNGLDIKDFVINGSSEKTSARVTRSETIDLKKRHRDDQLTAVPAKKLKNTDATIDKELLASIQRLLIDRMGTHRPGWIVTLAALMDKQLHCEWENVECRLCLYCFGLFRKQAFQIDHINAASRRSPDAKTYNQASNLIPVCRTCNTSKGDAPLTKEWLDDQIQKRRDNNLPGLEMVAESINNLDQKDDDYEDKVIAYAKTQRHRILRK